MTDATVEDLVAAVQVLLDLDEEVLVYLLALAVLMPRQTATDVE